MNPISRSLALLVLGTSLGCGGSSHVSGTPGRGNPDAGADAASLSSFDRPVPSGPFEGEGTQWTSPVSRVTCRPGDQGETGTQGLGVDVRCNVDIVGSVAVNRFLSMAWWKDCAYINDSQANSTHVIDVSNDAQPTVGTSLTTPAMTNSWESMKVGPTGLLVAYQANNPVLDVYDVSIDCKNPVLKKSFSLGGSGHAGNFSPDGTIYYASSLYTSTVYAVDLNDPTNPTTITSNFGGLGSHDLNTGKGGNRAYFTFVHVASLGTGSIAIMDTTQIQARQSGAKGSVIKEYDWGDGSSTQYPIPVTYRGKDYLVVNDELGSSNCNDPNKPPYGYARILDISDEMNPKLVSLIKTEAQDPANCQAATRAGGSSFPAFGVGTHYCNVDRTKDPRLLACALFQSGLRIYDISNPWQPKDLAYMQTGAGGATGANSVSSLVRIIPETKKVWVATGSTFYVLRLPDSVIDPVFAATP
jgi:LVIVD repeat